MLGGRTSAQNTEDARESVGAHFSPCRTWRYSLTRHLPPSLAAGDGYSMTTCTFIGLNPSTADETKDDPTIGRCMRFARDWGYTRLKMVNLYAYRSTDPRGLWLADDPVGPENDHSLALAFGGSDLVVAAWGANARDDRLARFAETFAGWPLYALGVTKDGAPRHPLYMRADAVPRVYDLRGRNLVTDSPRARLSALFAEDASKSGHARDET